MDTIAVVEFARSYQILALTALPHSALGSSFEVLKGLDQTAVLLSIRVRGWKRCLRHCVLLSVFVSDLQLLYTSSLVPLIHNLACFF